MASNFFIDPSQIDQIQDERLRNQAREMLKQFPHLAPEAHAPQNEPQALKQPVSDDVLDYSNFGPQNVAAPPPATHVRPNVPTMKVDPVNHMFAHAETKEDQQQEPEEPVVRQPGTFDPTGKDHPILVKMRAALGMTTRKYNRTFSVAGVKYTMEPLDSAGHTRAVVLAALNSLNDAEYRLNIDTGLVAYSVSHIDNVPIEEVFSVPLYKDGEKDARGNPVKLMSIERKEVASQLFYNFLKSSPPAMTDALEAHYKQEFPPIDVLEKGQVFGHCPAPECQYVRIMGEEPAYCPYHGEQLTKEGDIPNPS
jgi:hypothetical protein